MRLSQMAAPRANWSYLHHVDDAKHEVVEGVDGYYSGG
jgi:hypothetical protein